MDIEEYIKTRVDVQQEYFSEKAGTNKKWYFLFITILLILNGIITVLGCFRSDDCIGKIIVGISALASIVSGITCSCQFREDWLSNRLISEHIKRELNLYRMRAGDYRELDEESAKDMFVCRFEGIVSGDVVRWKERKEKGE